MTTSISFSQKMGKRLCAARRVIYDTAKDFAKAHDVPASTYSQHETGKRALNSDTLVKYSEVLGVDPGWLLTGKGMPYPNETSTEKQALLYSYLDEYDKAQLYDSTPTTLIMGDMAKVDIPVFKAVLKSLLELVQKETLTIDADTMIEFSIDVYNSVAQTSASFDDKVKMIELSISSLLRGMASQTSSEGKETASR
ncbi:MAG: helix-turn-helix domain-containing protein [Gammaproteobacteria bacterium]